MANRKKVWEVLSNIDKKLTNQQREEEFNKLSKFDLVYLCSYLHDTYKTNKEKIKNIRREQIFLEADQEEAIRLKNEVDSLKRQSDIQLARIRGIKETLEIMCKGESSE